MSSPYMAEIRIFTFGFPPKGWAACNGQILSISQNQALFSLLGTTYGGNGQTTFGLPDLRGRAPVHVGNGSVQGEVSGEENHTLIISEMPAHSHIVNANSAPANSFDPTNAFMAKPTSNIYASSSNLTATGMSVGNTGGSQPHSNMQPYLVVNFCIALTGIFPSRS